MVQGLRAVRGNTRPIYRGEDYTNKVVGTWTVLGPIECKKYVSSSKNYRTKWLCQCSCGSEARWIDKTNILKGLSRGCSACYGTRNSGENNGNWKGHGEISGEVYNRIRYGAAFRDISLEVGLEDLNELWLKQGRCCALTGLPLVLLDSASLDRIDSSLGYTPGNVQWVHKTINKMKNDLPERVFLEMCTSVANHMKPPH